MPTTPRQSDSALHEFCCPVATGIGAVHYSFSTAHCPPVVWQCVAGDPVPTFLCPQLQYSRAHPVQCSAVHSSKQCGTAQKAVMVQRGTHGAVGLRDPV